MSRMTEEAAPEFHPGDEIMHVDPSGMIPWPAGPYTVIGCVHCEYDFKLYAVFCQTHGGQHVLDGMEMMGLNEWATTFAEAAN